MRPPVKLLVDDMKHEPYASILCYPRSEPQEVESRISELKGIGVTALEFAGECSAADHPVLGKGYTGVVLIAYRGEERFALKILRVDSGRDDMMHEAEMLKEANASNVGPRFEAVTKNFILSQMLTEGSMEKWLDKHRDKGTFRSILNDVLEQCWRLDRAGLYHRELSEAPGHLLMDGGRPFIVDFETASICDRPGNVTSVCNYIFLGHTFLSKLVHDVLGGTDRSGVIDSLRRYKNERSRESFEALLTISRIGDRDARACAKD